MPEHKKGVVPRLRFPEFRNAGEWDVERGDTLFGQISNRDHDGTLPVLAVTQEHGAIPREFIDYQVFVTEESLKSYKMVDIGDFIISLRTFQGGIEYSYYRGICSPAYIILRKANDKVFDDFYRHYFKTERYIRALNRNLEGLRDGKMVSYRQFSDIPLPFPSLPEQQKIADCLSSLDEVIELEAQKLDAFKTHKKGLMQQLFPREGETTPRLHFPEFRNAGEWIRTPVSEFGKVVTGKTPSTFKQEYWNGQFTWVTPTDISDRKNIYSSERRLTDEGITAGVFLPENSVLVTCIASIGKNAILKVPGSCNQQINAIIPNKEFVADFLYYLIENNSDILLDQAGTSATSIIPNSQFQKLSFLVPSLPEQHKIADCLSSLDEVIEFQAQKLEALKTHKKGLMQQLFPQEVD